MKTMSTLLEKLNAVLALSLVMAVFSVPVYAADKKTPSLSQADFKRFQVAFDLIEQQQWRQAKEGLNLLITESSSSYVKALAHYNLGKISLEREHYKSAIQSLQKARALEALPTDQNLSLLNVIGQLHCQLDQWKSCINVLQQWVKLAPNKVKAQDYILIAQANAQLERWASVIKPVNRAITLTKRPPKNWLQIAIVAHVELEQWPQAVKRQQQLIEYYPEQAEDWRQLVNLHLQQDSFDHALAVQRLGFHRGLLASEEDYQLLAQLLLTKGLPERAGEVLVAGLKSQQLERNEKVLTLLSQAWLHAKEWEQAESVLVRLNQLMPSAERAKKLAQVQMELKHWHVASKSLQLAIRLSEKYDPSLYIMLGIAEIHAKDFNAARSAFNKAVASQKEHESAQNWLNYIAKLDS